MTVRGALLIMVLSSYNKGALRIAAFMSVSALSDSLPPPVVTRLIAEWDSAHAEFGPLIRILLDRAFTQAESSTTRDSCGAD